MPAAVVPPSFSTSIPPEAAVAPSNRWRCRSPPLLQSTVLVTETARCISQRGVAEAVGDGDIEQRVAVMAAAAGGGVQRQAHRAMGWHEHVGTLGQRRAIVPARHEK
ncbi:unnamed protein product [Urochloa humidicola]